MRHIQKPKLLNVLDPNLLQLKHHAVQVCPQDFRDRRGRHLLIRLLGVQPEAEPWTLSRKAGCNQHSNTPSGEFPPAKQMETNLSTGSTGSLLSGRLANPLQRERLDPGPSSTDVVFLLAYPRIDDVLDPGDGDRGLCDVRR